MDIWIKILVPHQTGKAGCAVIWLERWEREVFSSDWNWVDLLSLCSENAIFELQLKTFSFSKVDFVSLENNKLCWRDPTEDSVTDRDAVQTEMWQKRQTIQEMWGLSTLHQVLNTVLSVSFGWKLSYSFRSELFCDGNVNCAIGTQLPAGLSHQLSL